MPSKAKKRRNGKIGNNFNQGTSSKAQPLSPNGPNQALPASSSTLQSIESSRDCSSAELVEAEPLAEIAKSQTPASSSSTLPSTNPIHQLLPERSNQTSAREAGSKLLASYTLTPVDKATYKNSTGAKMASKVDVDGDSPLSTLMNQLQAQFNVPVQAFITPKNGTDATTFTPMIKFGAASTSPTPVAKKGAEVTTSTPVVEDSTRPAQPQRESCQDGPQDSHKLSSIDSLRLGSQDRSRGRSEDRPEDRLQDHSQDRPQYYPQDLPLHRPQAIRPKIHQKHPNLRPASPAQAQRKDTFVWGAKTGSPALDARSEESLRVAAAVNNMQGPSVTIDFSPNRQTEAKQSDPKDKQQQQQQQQRQPDENMNNQDESIVEPLSEELISLDKNVRARIKGFESIYTFSKLHQRRLDEKLEPVLRRATGEQMRSAELLGGILRERMDWVSRGGDASARVVDVFAQLAAIDEATGDVTEADMTRVMGPLEDPAARALREEVVAQNDEMQGWMRHCVDGMKNIERIAERYKTLEIKKAREAIDRKEEERMKAGVSLWSGSASETQKEKAEYSTPTSAWKSPAAQNIAAKGFDAQKIEEGSGSKDVKKGSAAKDIKKGSAAKETRKGSAAQKVKKDFAPQETAKAPVKRWVEEDTVAEKQLEGFDEEIDGLSREIKILTQCLKKGIDGQKSGKALNDQEIEQLSQRIEQLGRDIQNSSGMQGYKEVSVKPENRQLRQILEKASGDSKFMKASSAQKLAKDSAAQEAQNETGPQRKAEISKAPQVAESSKAQTKGKSAQQAQPTQQAQQEQQVQPNPTAKGIEIEAVDDAYATLLSAIFSRALDEADERPPFLGSLSMCRRATQEACELALREAAGIEGLIALNADESQQGDKDFLFLGGDDSDDDDDDDDEIGSAQLEGGGARVNPEIRAAEMAQTVSNSSDGGSGEKDLLVGLGLDAEARVFESYLAHKARLAAAKSQQQQQQQKKKDAAPTAAPAASHAGSSKKSKASGKGKAAKK